MIANLVRHVWRAPAVAGAPGPLVRDWVLVAALCGTAVLEALLRHDTPWRGVAAVHAVALTFLLPWRRTYPFAVLTASLGASVLMSVAAAAAGVTGEVGLYTAAFVLLLPYTLFRWGSGREVVVGSAVILGAYGASIARDHSQLSNVIGGFVVLMLPVVLGSQLRNWSTWRIRELDQVRSRERELLARELHDTVAHHVSAMVVRAQAGRVVAGSRPAAAVEALEIIEAEGSRTLAEMRAMVGALRAGDDAELAPVGGIADIERLARPVDGQPAVRVSISGVRDDVSPSVEAALFRIAQESVTNARRHARHATQIVVRITGQGGQGGQIRLTVRDDGEQVSATRGPDGYGIVGMTERAKLLGGTVEAGPCPDRGWAVEAVLPTAGVAG